MNEKDDRTLLIETRNDVGWIKTTIIDLHKKQEKSEDAIRNLEKKLWYGSGLVVSFVCIVEFFKEKLFK